MDGFDIGDYALRPGVNAGGSVLSSTTTRFGAGRSITTAYTNTGNQYDKSFAAASSVFVGVAVRTDNNGAIANDFIMLYGDTGTTRHLAVRLNTATSIQLYRGDGTQLATATCPSFGSNAWHYIEISATIADSGGTAEVRVDGTSLISYTGDTKNGGTNTTIDMVRFTGNGGNVSSYFDDLYICDSTGSAPHNTFLGDVRVISLSPTAAGSSTQFTPDTGSNYARVNEIPYSAANYVQSGTSGNRDTYAMADLTGTPTILAVQTCVVAKKTDAGAMSMKVAIKSGATVYYGTTTALSSGDATVVDLRTTDPATSSAWTSSGVNALEAGAEVA